MQRLVLHGLLPLLRVLEQDLLVLLPPKLEHQVQHEQQQLRPHLRLRQEQIPRDEPLLVGPPLEQLHLQHPLLRLLVMLLQQVIEPLLQSLLHHQQLVIRQELILPRK